ncbi:MAG: hypothetical protein COA96_15895 [SAR86 cluster bacterium]|uniref:Uncharacterized protein n=1 Tax=SAR86 cluster bacterium TaxID=2030880 RepID=A0A2A5ALZ1_9GAMM|nr:MAG: hypothetical protein COA96_15895 [SAR86 cluster bacterium]
MQGSFCPRINFNNLKYLKNIDLFAQMLILQALVELNNLFQLPKAYSETAQITTTKQGQIGAVDRYIQYRGNFQCNCYNFQ